jgi:hypothetical protein
MRAPARGERHRHRDHESERQEHSEEDAAPAAARRPATTSASERAGHTCTMPSAT